MALVARLGRGLGASGSWRGGRRLPESPAGRRRSPRTRDDPAAPILACGVSGAVGSQLPQLVGGSIAARVCACPTRGSEMDPLVQLVGAVDVRRPSADL